MTSSAAPPAPTDSSPPTAPHPLSPLEQDVLAEYERLLSNLNKVRIRCMPPTPLPPPLAPSPLRPFLPHHPWTFHFPGQEIADPFLGGSGQLSRNLSELSTRPTGEVLDGLRMLERKTSLVFTLLKASVYSIVLQQQIYSGEEGGG